VSLQIGDGKTGSESEQTDRLKELAERLRTRKSLSKAERAKTARKKKREGSKGKQFVANTKKARVSLKIKK
jgi:hypothetical protein